MKWIDQAIRERRVLVKGARRSGKTHAALKWITEIGVREVLFVSQSEYASMAAFETMMQTFPFNSRIESVQRGNKRITLTNGTRIHFTGSVQSTRGLRMDAVVLDDMGHRSDMDVSLLFSTAAARPDFPFFATYTNASSDGINRIHKMERVEPVHTITVDYLDMVQEGRISADDIREIMMASSTKAFAEEFGPFNRDGRPFKMKNKMFKHLLSKKA